METASRSLLLLKFVLLVVVFPLALAAVGIWQYSRTTEMDTIFATVSKTVAVIEQVQQTAGDPHVFLRMPDGKTVQASAALQHNKKILEQTRRVAWWQRMVCGPLALGVIFCGLLGAGVGAYGLFSVRLAGARALHSREVLLLEFRKGLRKLPWLVGGIGLCIALEVALGGLFEIVDAVVDDFRGRAVVRPLVMGSLCVGMGLFFSYRMIRNIYAASRSVFERAPRHLMGKNVTREDAPLLWDFVKSVADRTGAAMPDVIVLGLDDSFFVSEHPVELLSGEPVPEGRILYLPLPHMAYMGRAEAEAVLGHELSHFTGADTEYSQSFASIYSAAVYNLHAVDTAADGGGNLMRLATKPAILFGIYYLDSFDLAVQHWNRERELAADKVGAGIAGTEAVALSLLRIVALTPCVYRALGECWSAGGSLEGGVLGRVGDIVREHGLGDPAEYLEEQQAHPTDSHPATKQRLEALGVPVTKELLERVQSRKESGLLRELGLEDDGGGLRFVLETEFSHAAGAEDNCIPEDPHEIAALGMDRIVMHESAFVGILMLSLLGLGGTGFGVVALIKGAALPFWLGGFATGVLCTMVIICLLRRCARPLLVLTAEGFSAGTMDKEIPWTVVRDYWVAPMGGYGVQPTIDLTVELEDGYIPPESIGDKRATFIPHLRLLRISAVGIAGPHTLETFANQFHTHWRGALARAALR